MVGGESRLRANHIHGNAGNGITIIDAATPDIRHNTFANNGDAGQLDIDLDQRVQANIVENSFDDRRNNVGPARPSRTDRLRQQNFFPGVER
jgi:parallel beta-helix repeat protein